MRLNLDTLSILEDITSDAVDTARVELDLRGAKNSNIRIYYANGGARTRLEWDRNHTLTPECNERVLRDLRDDPYLATILASVLADDETEENEAEETPDLAALSEYAAPPTMFL